MKDKHISHLPPDIPPTTSPDCKQKWNNGICEWNPPGVCIGLLDSFCVGSYEILSEFADKFMQRASEERSNRISMFD